MCAASRTRPHIPFLCIVSVAALQYRPVLEEGQFRHILQPIGSFISLWWAGYSSHRPERVGVS